MQLLFLDWILLFFTQQKTFKQIWQVQGFSVYSSVALPIRSFWVNRIRIRKKTRNRIRNVSPQKVPVILFFSSYSIVKKHIRKNDYLTLNLECH